MNNPSRWLPGVVVALGGLYLLLVAVPSGASDTQMNLDEFGKIPVVDRGRIKPLDTVARVNLMVISDGKQTFKDPEGKTQPAIKWLLDAMTSDGLFNHQAKVHQYKVFRIDNLELLGLLGLEIRPGSYRYAFAEILPKLPDLMRQVEKARKKRDKERDLIEVKCLELDEHLKLYQQTVNLSAPLLVPPQANGQDWQPYDQVMTDAQHVLWAQIKAEAERAGLDMAKLDRKDLFAKFHPQIARFYAGLPPPVRALGEIFDAYKAGKADQFNRAVAEYHQNLDHVPADDLKKVSYEVFFNHFDAFTHCGWLYFAVFLLASASWLVGVGEPLRRAAFWLAILTLVVHSFALLSRMYIQGRPPVTNLYSAAVFIGWGCLVLALILEGIFANGLGSFVAGLAGFATMRLALFLGGSGDTLEMMQAVLDTNFWLATHVTIVTSGYAATFVAGLLGAIYILRGVFTPSLDKDLAKNITQMIYGTVCFATLLSFTGTVLGGIWADQSWGRFWGWDPKENGALIIVIWNALILHARWAGMVKQRGLAVLTIVGNMVTGWSMFGTNQLGVGLHAYGFNNALAVGLRWFWISQVALIVIGLTPLSRWRSFASPNVASQPPKPSTRGKGKLAAAR
jgi:ABC-type transport system involved in cytochrome c biogenesis permease subunit